MKFTVGRKLWIGFSVVLLLTMIVGLTGYWSLNKMNKEYQFLINDRMEKVRLLEELSSTQYKIANDIRGYLLFNQVSYLSNRQEQSERLNTSITSLEKLLNEKEDRELFEELKDASVSYENSFNKAVDEFMDANDEIALDLAADAGVFQKVIEKNSKKIIEHQTKEKSASEKKLQKLVKDTQMLIFIAIGSAILLSIIIAYFISKSIAPPVKKMTSALSEIAKGNFAIDPVTIRNKDEIGDMSKAFNAMAFDLRDVIGNVRVAAVQLSEQAENLSASSKESLAASEMVADVSENNLRDSDEQIVLVNESSTAMEEMIRSIDSITNNNEAMHDSSDEVAKLVVDGATMMGQVTEQMNTISNTIGHSAGIISEMANHSEEIRNVTKMITSLAEQTNLLALNAAIEAARAGEQGKGFAVVADEVRSLAEQSKQSAGEIGQMIDIMIANVSRAVSSTKQGNERVEEGLIITDNTREVFTKIEQASADVGAKVITVIAAIEQTTVMTNRVSESASKVQKLAQQSAEQAQSTSAATEEQLAVTEEITANAHSLAQLAEQLQTSMSRFTI